MKVLTTNTMKKISLLILILLWFNATKSQEQNVVFTKASKTITSDDLKKIVYTLASPEMEGRGVGTKGIDKASEFIAKSYTNDGIGYIPALNGYFQKVSFSLFRLLEPDVKIGNKICAANIDYIGYTSTIASNQSFDIAIIQNTSPDYIKTLDIQSKTVLILTSDIFFTKKPLYDLLIKKGCRGVLLCNPYNPKEFKNLCKINSSKKLKQIERYKRSFSGSVATTDSLLKSLTYKKIYISTLVISPAIASSIVGVDINTICQRISSNENDTSIIKTSSVKIDVKQGYDQVKDLSNNVLGFIEGSEFKDETVVISAHYDHLGIDGGNNMRGADDNASGVAAVLEIAEAYSNAINDGFRPKRSILFAAFTAEEMGLCGSRFFINHIDSLKLKPIVDLNADMIGRGEDSLNLKKSKVKKLYIVAAKKDTSLVRIVKSLYMGIDSLNVDYSQVGGSNHMYSSDQASFILNGIPAAMFFRGLHPDYHTMRDTPEKLDYETMEKVTRLIFSVSWKYVNGE